MTKMTAPSNLVLQLSLAIAASVIASLIVKQIESKVVA